MIKQRILDAISLMLLAAVAVGCSKSGTLEEPERPLRSDQILDFATLYGQNCAGCHGANGQFGPAPPINDPLFLSIVPDAVLLQLVAEGRPGTLMPAFSRKHGGALTDGQVQALASGIKSHWKAEHPQIQPPDYQVTKTEDRGNLGRGERIFDRACAACHGTKGLGGKEKVGPIHDASFLALISDQAIRRYIITGRRDLKMPDFAQKSGRPSDFKPLTTTDVDDLVKLLSSWRRGYGTDRAETSSH